MNTVRYPALPSSSRTVVLITEAECESLGEYSMSVPTGVYVGKWWKRNLNVYKHGAKPLWRACCYGPSDKPDVALIHFCPIQLVTA